MGDATHVRMLSTRGGEQMQPGRGPKLQRGAPRGCCGPCRQRRCISSLPFCNRRNRRRGSTWRWGCWCRCKGHRNSDLFHSDNTSPILCLDEPIQTITTMLFQRWLVVVWLAVVSSADGLYAVALWLGCRGTSVSAWGPFWPPMPRPRLLLLMQPGEDGVWFP